MGINKQAIMQLEIIDREEIIQDIKINFDKINILLNGVFSGIFSNNKKIYTEGKFDDDLWVLENHLTQSHLFIYFKSLDSYRFKGLIDSDIQNIKSWIAYRKIENPNLATTSLRAMFSSIQKFIDITDNFKEETSDKEELIELLNQQYKDTEKDLEDKYNSLRGKSALVTYTIDYLEYISEYLNIESDINSKYLIVLKNIKSKLKVKYSPRKLPKIKDIIIFSKALEELYNNSRDEDLRVLYMPILIWWKVTNVIPMRISELCIKTDRKCIVERNDKFYLKIKRVKNTKSKRNFELPILDEIEINKETASLIKDYIEITDKYGSSDTLFSYKALIGSKVKIEEKGTLYKFNHNNFKKKQEIFSSVIFKNLLITFYEQIIYRTIDKNQVRRINPGDTRHFAFFSLLMQGLDPIEIALLGGHTTLIAQENYEYGLNYYVSSEAYEYINRNLSNIKYTHLKDNEVETLQNIIKNMPQKCPKPIIDSRPLKVGYCVCDFDKSVTCDDVDDCCFCSKWWCYPSKDNYINKKKLLEEKVLKRLELTIKTEVEYMNTLINKIKIKNFEGQPILEERQGRKIKTSTNKIKHLCDKVKRIEFSIIDFDEIKRQIDGTVNAMIDLESKGDKIGKEKKRI